MYAIGSEQWRVVVTCGLHKGQIIPWPAERQADSQAGLFSMALVW